MKHRFILTDVFTTHAFGGNQLAVFPDGTGISDTLMQAFARELNFSETTFVLPPRKAGHTHRVRIFTPHSELPFAGHGIDLPRPRPLRKSLSPGGGVEPRRGDRT